MTKSKEYKDTRFDPEIIKEAYNTLLRFAPKEQKIISSLSVNLIDEKWDHDNEDEFFSDYRKEKMKSSSYSKGMDYGAFKVSVWVYNRDTTVSISCTERKQIEAVFSVFDKNLSKSKLEPIIEEKIHPVIPKIFIGHGKDGQWRDLKDHLQDKHQYVIEAYEVGARAGHEIRDVLQSMLDKSSFAILVMTGENDGLNGKLYPRLNVIHELGLFQGGLGFDRAVVLLEEGVEEFSNISGVTQIRYPKDKIKETFGEVLATLKRGLQN